jgi:hypothetical protein
VSPGEYRHVGCVPGRAGAADRELSAFTGKAADSDGKRQILSKDEIDETLGRSPACADWVKFRMVFEPERAAVGFYVLAD